jgi:hypothetical protein
MNECLHDMDKENFTLSRCSQQYLGNENSFSTCRPPETQAGTNITPEILSCALYPASLPLTKAVSLSQAEFYFLSKKNYIILPARRLSCAKMY